jgi:hypothetical protein
MASPGLIDKAPYLPTGNPASSVETNKFRSGELGHVYIDYGGRRWQNVKMDTVLTQAAVASNLVYWAAGHGFGADTDLTDSEAGRNTVAGVLASTTDGFVAPVASQTFWIIQEGQSITLNGTNVNFQANESIIASSTVGLVDRVAAGTSVIYRLLGTVHTAVDRSGGAGTVVCDIDIPSRTS